MARLNGLSLGDRHVGTVLDLLDSGETAQLEIMGCDRFGNRSYKVDSSGLVEDCGIFKGSHWILCEYWYKTVNHKQPDAIAYDDCDRQVSIYHLNHWESKALSGKINMVVGLYVKDGVLCHHSSVGSTLAEFCDEWDKRLHPDAIARRAIIYQGADSRKRRSLVQYVQADRAKD